MKNEPINNLFPIFLKLEELNLLIVGGGNIALEKLTAVLKNSPGTFVTLVAQEVHQGIAELAASHPNVKLIQRSFLPADLENRDLIIAATGNRELSEEIKKEAKARKILINVADTPDLCDFYLGSVVTKGDLKIAISTNGKSPTLAKRLRQYLELTIPDGIQHSIENLNLIRNRLKGDFQHKVQKLNELTDLMLSEKK